MKLRNSLMALIFLLAIGASLVAKSKGGTIPASFIVPGTTGCAGGTTQDGCNYVNTGPVCTVFVLNTNVTAYHPGAPGIGIPCTVPLRQP